MANKNNRFSSKTMPYLRLISNDHFSTKQLLNSILSLSKELVALKTQGGIDNPGPLIEHAAAWLGARGIETDILVDGIRGKRRKIGLVARLGSAPKGPTYGLTACVDTAPFGSDSLWTYPPNSARIESGRMYGRGTADSKVAAAIFMHLMVELAGTLNSQHGNLVLLLDADEHTGRFGAIKQFLSEYRRIDGVFIGYPGNDSIKIGARGFARARVRLWAPSGHTGSRKNPEYNVFEKARLFIQEVGKIDISSFYSNEYEMAPKVSVTGVHGGGGFTMYADSCSINVDCRLVPGFSARDFQKIIRNICQICDTTYAHERNSSIKFFQSWPPYLIDTEANLINVLRESAINVFNKNIPFEKSGPSNVGNFLASKGIDATCGFGVSYQNIHAPDEFVNLDTIIPVYNVYSSTIKRLLNII